MPRKLKISIELTPKVNGGMSSVMGGFDTLAMCAGMIDPDNPLTALNNKLHQSKLYNGFQEATGVIATFTGGALSTMACFIAGTYVLALDGFKRIEDIVAGDKIMAADPNTFEISEKTVIETYVRQVDKLVHITINGEEIVTTDNHPFYVQGRGFIEAGNLLVGDKLISVNGEDLIIEDYYIELTDEPVSVYNFQVEDFHTYFVGDCAVWVHNITCSSENAQSLKKHLEGTAEKDGVKINPDTGEFTGVNGCHSKDSFLKALDEGGGTVLESEPINAINGVEKITYQKSSGGTGYKTVYDTDVISTEEYMNAGLSTLKKVPNTSAISSGQGSITVTVENNSGKMSWQYFFKSGELKTMYPTNDHIN